jgi:ribosomal protein S18 acetylase RimI-like enzyme
MPMEFSALARQDKEEVLACLRVDPAKHALVLQNLTEWEGESKFFFERHESSLSYVHRSGHPAHRHGPPTFVIDGEPAGLERLLRQVLPASPFVVRESPAALEGVLRACYPDAKVKLEHRMDVNSDEFRPHHRGLARQLNERDVSALCRFMGAPEQAAPRFIGWLQGAKVFYGIEENGELRAIGSSMVCLPEIFNIVSIETHKDHRGKGYGTELTSGLVAECLRHTGEVCLTVFADNQPALRVYEKLGFRIKEDRMWANCGTP